YLKDLYGNGTEASYEGYVPTFIGNLKDYNGTLGYKSKVNEWNTDASITFGGNEQTYDITNSQNSTKNADGTFKYGISSPIAFKPGGTKFDHIVGNIDISRVLSKKISIGFGSEFRTENFEILAGDVASYDGNGADSFQGNRPENSGKFNRYNMGAYFDIAYDVTKDFLINGTARVENYSDFGSAAVWKLSSRYKFMDDKMNIRASLSTGFRAPSLHQIYTEKSQSTFQGGAIAITGIVNNVSTAANLYDIPKLTAEKSVNFTTGIGFKPTKNFNLTVDYYNILVDDRIVLGNLVSFQSKLDTDPNSDNFNKYIKSGESAFFVNALDTKTSGIDLVATYRNIALAGGKLGLNFSGNYTLENKLVGAVRNPTSIKNLGTPNAAILPGETALTSGQNPVLGGQTVFNATQEALMFTSRPIFKAIIGADYEINKIGFSLNNTVFGPTKFKQADFSDPGLSTEFDTKLVTDLGINYNFNSKVTIAANINNIFDVLPSFKIVADGSASAQAIVNDPAKLKTQMSNITFNGRYAQMSYDGYHFSQLGRMYNLSLSYKF
ncbi:MAG: TonB-dependent receptor, partial [Sphingobacteriaceae bacterium]|nr:TonB-dependent receptor [Sphingobacteriaceae bacterium]